MADLFLFLTFVFGFTFIVGNLLEKIRIPWIFAPLILGAILSIQNPFEKITSSQIFEWLAQIGMLFLLFIIGFEIDLKKMKKLSNFILKSTFSIIVLEAILGTIIIRFLFNYDFLISFLVALSFATVGEAFLLPILEEFKLVRNKFGQTLLGIGTLDNLIEILVLFLVIFLISTKTFLNFLSVLASLILIFLLTYVLTKLKEEGRKFSYLKIETLFLFSIFIFFFFIGIGQIVEAAAFAALLSGIALRTFLPKKRIELIESEVKTMAYGFFSPLFFLSVGVSISPTLIYLNMLGVLAITFVAYFGKILASYLIGRKELGKKKSIALGIGLSIRFSTSIIIIKILLEGNLIGVDLYSAIIASTILFKFFTPLLFSYLLVRWKIAKT